MPEHLSAEYLAGLFDGEGCVTAYEGMQHGVRAAQCEIQLANTHEGIIARISREQGGSYQLNRSSRFGKHQVWIWRLTGAKAERFAEFIAPHAVIKRDQLELFLRLRATILQGGRKGVSDEVWRQRRELIAALKSAKRAYLVAYEIA